MTERPILFSGPMVRAVIDGTKTQTRRVVKPQPHHIGVYSSAGVQVDWVHVDDDGDPTDGPSIVCPYGVPGDRLWVRETFYCDHFEYDSKKADPSMRANFLELMAYRADHDCRSWEAGCPCRDEEGRGSWRPSIHMPRWASRITLEVTSVRIERLHAITEGDAWFEGVEMQGQRWRNYAPPERESSGIGTAPTARESFFSLWEAINGTESLAANPWVWVIGFKRVEVSGG